MVLTLRIILKVEAGLTYRITPSLACFQVEGVFQRVRTSDGTDLQLCNEQGLAGSKSMLVLSVSAWCWPRHAPVEGCLQKLNKDRHILNTLIARPLQAPIYCIPADSLAF